MTFVYWARLPSHTDVTAQGYVGITSRAVAARWTVHRKLAERGENPCKILQAAIRKHGAAIAVVPLVQASEAYCLELEKRLRPAPGIGWNVGVGGQATATGLRRSDVTKAKLNAHKVGKPRSPETRAKIAAALTGNRCATGSVRTPEMKAAASVRARGYRHTEEAKARIGAAAKGNQYARRKVPV